MKKYFKERIDNTRQAYLDALNRLKAGNPTHKDLVCKEFKINATTIAMEAGKSRNPLYHTHKDILDMINETKENEKIIINTKQEKSELAILKEKYNFLEEENKKLLNVNATLLFQLRSKL